MQEQRRRMVAGNWKMNKTLPESAALARDVVKATAGAAADVVLCPSFVSLAAVAEALKGSAVALGAQDVHFEERGAFTGKISCEMLKSAGVRHVIVGHSEQRTYFHETDDSVNQKAKAALKAGLFPIICVGETLSQRESNATLNVITTQVRGAYLGVPEADAQKSVIAYEPVWAIGTGKVAAPGEAQEVHRLIRNLLVDLYGKNLSLQFRILYGGSVNAQNAGEIFRSPDVDGGLIGGASLKADEFRGIVFA